VGRRASLERLSGFTLIELVVVCAIIAVLAALAIPSLSGLTRMSSEGAARTTFRSLFASARVRAATLQRYVGIRFQQDKDGRTYAIMLVTPDAANEVPSAFPGGCPNYVLNQACTFLTFVAAPDIEPIQLPRGVELAAGDYLQSLNNPAATPNPADVTPWTVDEVKNLRATTFTVVFSPSGQIVRRLVHVSQRRDQWVYDAGSNKWGRSWSDPVFNLCGTGMFLPDVDDTNSPCDKTANALKDTDPDPQNETSSPAVGPNTTRLKHVNPIAPTMSQTSIWVYERQKRVDAGATPFTGYIQQSGTLVPLNVYTGAPVNTQQ